MESEEDEEMIDSVKNIPNKGISHQPNVTKQERLSRLLSYNLKQIQDNFVELSNRYNVGEVRKDKLTDEEEMVLSNF